MCKPQRHLTVIFAGFLIACALPLAAQDSLLYLSLPGTDEQPVDLKRLDLDTGQATPISTIDRLVRALEFDAEGRLRAITQEIPPRLLEIDPDSGAVIDELTTDIGDDLGLVVDLHLDRQRRLWAVLSNAGPPPIGVFTSAYQLDPDTGTTIDFADTRVQEFSAFGDDETGFYGIYRDAQEVWRFDLATSVVGPVLPFAGFAGFPQTGGDVDLAGRFHLLAFTGTPGSYDLIALDTLSGFGEIRQAGILEFDAFGLAFEFESVLDVPTVGDFGLGILAFVVLACGLAIIRRTGAG